MDLQVMGVRFEIKYWLESRHFYYSWPTFYRCASLPKRQFYFKIPICITKPESDLSPSVSSSSGTRQTRNSLLNAVSHASNTSDDRSCCATMQTVDFSWRGLSEEASLHASTQVCTNGAMRASLYMQSHAMTASKREVDGDPVSDAVTSSVSQSSGWAMILLCGRGTGTDCPPFFGLAVPFRPLLEDEAACWFSARFSPSSFIT